MQSFNGLVSLGVLVVIIVASLIGIVMIIVRANPVPGRLAIPLFCGGWFSLFLAGVFASGAIFDLISLPLAAIGLVVIALFYKLMGPWRIAPAFCFWAGTALLVWGVFHFGAIVAALNALATNYAGPFNLPVQPHLREELLIWSIPAAIVCLASAWNNRFLVRRVVTASIPLMLLNSAIVVFGVWICLPLSL